MMMQPPPPPGTRPPVIHTRRYVWLLPVLAVVVVAAIAFRWLSETPRDLQLTQGQQSGTLREEATPTGQRAVPSTGGATTAAAATSGSLATPAIVKELETITGVLDGHELIGRRVDLRVPVWAAGAGDTTFWIGMGDNRLLVVLERDTRNQEDRGQGTPARHGVKPVDGRVASIIGTVQQVPEAEERFSWRLTREEEDELLERNVYIRAERVVADGHGE